MEDVYRMYAMSDGELDAEPFGLDSDQEDDFEEDDEVETAGVLTSSDDDEGVEEEAVIVIAEIPEPPLAIKKPPKS